MLKQRLFAIAAALALLELSAGTSHAYDLESRVVEHTLANGLKIIILPRKEAPVAALYITCVVGSVDEPAGRSGMAHLVEHMLFKGTTHLGTSNWAAEEPLLRKIDEAAGSLDRLRRLREEGKAPPGADAELERRAASLASLQAEAAKYVVKDEIDSLYTQNGAENANAYTSRDVTVYLVSIPANRLELWAAIESDRMRDPVFREFYSERDVVMEERRQSYDTQPERLLMETFLATAFAAHPYRRPVIGWPSDVKYLTRPVAEAFFKKYYAPDNAVITVVGDVEPQAVISLVERYFGTIPPSGDMGRAITREPEQRGEKRVFLEAESNPSLVIGWHKPTLPHRDDYVLDVIDGLLSGGRTSRLYRRLVERERAAARVDSTNGVPGARYDSLFVVTAVPLAPRTPEDAERLVYEELERLKSEPVPDEEMAKVRTQIKAEFVRGLQSNNGLANTLSHFQVAAGDWRYLTRYDAVLDTITKEEIMETARRYFTPENRTVGILKRKP